jgi:hypothetical protein
MSVEPWSLPELVEQLSLLILQSGQYGRTEDDAVGDTDLLLSILFE